jgi:hypothetical protein
MSKGPQPPLPGLQNPVVGSGAEYEMSVKGKEMDMAYAVVGKEEVNGSPGVWLETRMQSPEMAARALRNC